MSWFEWLDWMDRTGFEAMRFLAGLTWQATLLFGALFASSFLVRGWSSSLKRSLWLAAFVSLPLLPLLGTFGAWFGAPQKTIAFLPAYTPTHAAFWNRAREFYKVSEAVAETSATSTSPANSFGQDQAKRGFSSLSHWGIAFLAYAAVLIVLLGRLAYGQIRIRSWIRASKLLDPHQRSPFWAAGRVLELRRPFLVRECPLVDSPYTVGWFRPVILLPLDFARTVSESDQHAIALHEVSHIKRFDTLALAFVALLKGILFFHPLVWIGARRLRELIEETADDTVLRKTQDPLSYAKMLTRFAEEIRLRPSSCPESAVGFLISKSAFLRRIEFIVSDRHKRLFRVTYKTVSALAIGTLVISELVIAFPLAESFYRPMDARSGLFNLLKPSHRVGKGGDFPTVQAALSDPSVEAGHRIEILSPVVEGDLLIDKSVELIGGNHGLKTEIRGGLNVAAPGVVLRNLSITNPLGDGISLFTDGAGLYVENCEIGANSRRGIAIDANKVVLTVRNTLICRNLATGIEVDSNEPRVGTRVRLERSVLAENGLGFDREGNYRRAIDWRDTRNGSLVCKDCVFVGTADGLGDRVVTSNSHDVDGMEFHFSNCVIARPPSFDRSRLNGGDDSRGLQLEYKSSGGINVVLEGITIAGFSENRIRTKNGSQSKVRIHDAAIRDVEEKPLILRENMGEFSISNLLIEGGHSDELLKIEGCTNATFDIQNVILRNGNIGLSMVNNGDVAISVLGMVVETNHDAIRVERHELREDWRLPVTQPLSKAKKGEPYREGNSKTGPREDEHRVKVARYLMQEDGRIDYELASETLASKTLAEDSDEVTMRKRK